MKNKVVVWGTNAENEKVLIALELKADANKVMLYTFPEAIATDDFVNKMMNEWRDGKPVEFPEGHTTLERELSVTESLLPDDLKVERGDLIQRAQTEWHFTVLSTKLHAAYEQELAEFKEKVEALSAYDNKLWDSLRAFWDKVQGQSRERNLFREHADHLRDNINALFDDMKKLRRKMQNEFVSASQGVFDEFAKALDDIETRIAAGGSKLNSVFEDLKQMQRRYRDARLSNEHRNQLWDRLDGAFKKAKERKFGPSANEGSVTERHERRLGGLLDAIRRMEESVRRDEEELNFQRKKVNTSEGQLEAQIRMAKIKMIEERLVSKREKLAEMNTTRADVERQTNSAKDKEARRAEKEAERQKIEAAKEAAKSEIAAQIKTKPGDKIKPEKEDSFFEAAGTVLGDLLVDALDTAKAVATVAAEKADEMLEKTISKAEEVAEVLTKKEEPKNVKEGVGIDDAMHESATDAATLESTTSAETTGDKAKIMIDDIVHQAEDFLEKAVTKIEKVVDVLTKEDKPKSGKGKIVVPKSEEGLESATTAETGDKGKIIIDDIVHNSEEGLESATTAEAGDKGKIIIDDIVHNSEEGLESATAATETGDKGKIIIDDIVHNSEEGLESATAATETGDKGKIIIDDIVHNSEEGSKNVAT